MDPARIAPVLAGKWTKLLACGALAAAVAAAGCGDEDGAATDLTGFAPADAVVFAEGAIKPEGDRKDSVEAILERFPNGDQVGSRLVEELNSSIKEDGSDATYEDDIEPWLGETAAFFATSFSAGDDGDNELEQGAFIVETTDEDQAREKIREFAEEEGGPVEEQEYEGISYDLSEDDSGDPIAAGVFDGVAVVGTERGFKDAVDAAAGESLSTESSYADFRDGLGDELMGSLYADGQGILDAIPASPGFSQQQRRQLRRTYGQYLEEPILGALAVTDDQATLEFSAAATEAGIGAGQASPLLESGFADSWAASAIPDIGRSFGTAFSQAASQLPRAEINQVNSQLQRQLGFSLDDISDIGDAAFFAAGESITELQVGGLFEVPDADARDRLLDAIRTGVQRSGQGRIEPLNVEGADDGFAIRLPDLPVPINVAAAGERVAVGVGPSTTALLSGDGGLTDSESFQSATEAVGEGSALNLLVEFAPIVALVESTGQDDADFAEAREYLDAMEFVAVGTEQDGDRASSRFVVNFSDSE